MSPPAEGACILPGPGAPLAVSMAPDPPFPSLSPLPLLSRSLSFRLLPIEHFCYESFHIFPGELAALLLWSAFASNTRTASLPPGLLPLPGGAVTRGEAPTPSSALGGFQPAPWSEEISRWLQALLPHLSLACLWVYVVVVFLKILCIWVGGSTQRVRQKQAPC